MSIRSSALAGLSVVLVQYFFLSEMSKDFVLPELGLLVLVLSRKELSLERLLLLAVAIGYVADVVGAIRPGQYILGYGLAAASIYLYEKYSHFDGIRSDFVVLILAFGVFHIVQLLYAGPVFIDQWLVIVLLQIFVGFAMVVINQKLQRLWRIGR